MQTAELYVQWMNVEIWKSSGFDCARLIWLQSKISRFPDNQHNFNFNELSTIYSKNFNASGKCFNVHQEYPSVFVSLLFLRKMLISKSHTAKFKRHWTVENCVIQETPKHLCAAACTKEQNSGSVRKAFTHLNFLSLYYCEQKQCIAIFNVESFAIFIRWTKIILQYKLTVLNCAFFSSQFVRLFVG